MSAIEVEFSGIEHSVLGSFDESDLAIQVDYTYNVDEESNDPRVKINSDGSKTVVDGGGFYFEPYKIIEAKLTRLNDDELLGTLIGAISREGNYKGLFLDRASEAYKFRYFIEGIHIGYEEKTLTKASFSFNTHSDWAASEEEIAVISHSIDAGKTSIHADIGNAHLWSVKLDDARTLSLDSIINARFNVRSVLPEMSRTLTFSIEDSKGKLSFKEIVETVRSIQDLLSLGMWGERESVRSIRVWKTHREFTVRSKDIGHTDTQNPGDKSAFNSGSLTKFNYKEWLRGNKWVDPYTGILLGSFEHRNDDAIRVLLTSVLSLSDKVSTDKGKDDGKKITQIVNFSGVRPLVMGKGSLETAKSIGQRLRDGRTYWVHEILENELSVDAQKEMLAHLSILRCSFLLTILKASGLNDLRGKLLPGWKAAIRINTLGYSAWSRLDGIRLFAEERAARQKLKEKEKFRSIVNRLWCEGIDRPLPSIAKIER